MLIEPIILLELANVVLHVILGFNRNHRYVTFQNFAKIQINVVKHLKNAL